MDQNTPTDTPRVALWRISREMLGLIMGRLLEIPVWDAQATYFASQLDVIAKIGAMIQPEPSKIKIGNVLPLRTLLEAVTNAIAASHIPEYAEEELKRAKSPRILHKERTKSKSQHERFKLHYPKEWQAKEEAERLWERGNSVVHSDADSGFYLRADGLHAVDVRGFSLAIYSLCHGAQSYLSKVGAFYPTQEESDKDLARFKEALVKVVNEGTVKQKGELHPFEARVYTELIKHDVQLKWETWTLESEPSSIKEEAPGETQSETN